MRSSAAASSNRALFALWCLFWLLMLAVSYQEHHARAGIRWWEPLVWESSSAIVASVWLFLQRRAARRWSQYLDQPLRWFGRHLAWLPVVLPTFITAMYALRHAVYAATHERYEHESWEFLLLYEGIKLVLFGALWVSIIFGLESFVRWKQERERLLVLQTTLAQAQLNQLKAQLQPHFLFNTLNTISALMQTDVARADRLLARLADLLRASLAGSSRPMTSLGDEIQLLELYASIMQERFEGRVSLEWKVADEERAAAIPTMLLQPLLENAYKHGVERSRAPVQIEIRVRREAQRLHISIANPGTLTRPGSPGIGLKNCRERLALLYGDAATLDLIASGDRVSAQLVLPWQEHAG